MKSELTFHRPNEGQFIRFYEIDNDGAEQMYLPLPEDGSELTAQDAYDTYTTGYQTEHDPEFRGLEYKVRLTLCEIDSDGDEADLDDWGTWNFYADGKGGTLDEEELEDAGSA